jgi:nucleoside phosphorylase
MNNIFLFITANLNEREAFEKRFKFKSKGYIKGKSYKIGKFGLHNVAYIHIDEQSTDNPATTQTIGGLIQKIEPIGVVMVGIAFGVNEKKQKIGDVLVAKKILSYNYESIQEDSSEYREDPKEVGFQFFNAFNDDEDWKHHINEIEISTVHKGAMLTGSKLINNVAFRNRLLKDFKRYSPIGGEMEAYGVYSACRFNETNEWIIIKGICDWAYNKDKNKEKNQKIAAEAAVEFCYHVFTRKGIFDDLIKKYTNASDSAKKKESLPENIFLKHNRKYTFDFFPYVKESAFKNILSIAKSISKAPHGLWIFQGGAGYGKKVFLHAIWNSINKKVTAMQFDSSLMTDKSIKLAICAKLDNKNIDTFLLDEFQEISGQKYLQKKLLNIFQNIKEGKFVILTSQNIGEIKLNDDLKSLLGTASYKIPLPNDEDRLYMLIKELKEIGYELKDESLKQLWLKKTRNRTMKNVSDVAWDLAAVAVDGKIDENAMMEVLRAKNSGIPRRKQRGIKPKET